MKNDKKYSILPDGDSFGPKILYVGDEVRYIVPDSTSSELANVLEIPDFSMVKIQPKGSDRTRTIYRDRITAVFPRFK